MTRRKRRLDHTHGQNVVFTSGRELFGRHQTCLGLYKEFSMFIPLFNAVRDFSIRSVITIRRNDPINWVSFIGPLFFWFVPLWKLDLVDFLQKQRPVVVFIQNFDDDTDGGGFSRNTMVSDGDLNNEWKKKKSSYYQMFSANNKCSRQDQITC